MRTLWYDDHRVYQVRMPTNEIRREQFLRVLALIGPGLEALSIGSDALDDATLASAIASCQELRSLRIDDGKFQSMAALQTAYTQQQCKISSLDLVRLGGDFDLAEFESLLQLLQSDPGAAATLTRLRFGRQWSAKLRQSTANVVRDVLKTNKALSHLHIFHPASGPNTVQEDPIEWHVAERHGEAMGEPATQREVRVMLDEEKKKRLY